MTLRDIAELERETITCKQAAAVLGMGEYTLHEQAIQRPESLGFPVLVSGRRVRIPKNAFICFMNGTLKN